MPSLGHSQIQRSGLFWSARLLAQQYLALGSMRARGTTPEPHQVDALCERTEGWAAGLVLAGMSLAASTDGNAFVAAFQGDDRLVVDYLTEEFLSGITEADHDRLLRTSILDRLNAPLIDAL